MKRKTTMIWKQTLFVLFVSLACLFVSLILQLVLSTVIFYLLTVSLLFALLALVAFGFKYE